MLKKTASTVTTHENTIINITYQLNNIPPVSSIIELYNNAGLNRPTGNAERIANMYNHSNLIVTAWDKNRLVGIARSITDFCYCCYLSDLAVREDYQNKGIGRTLIELTKAKIGEETMLLLLSAPAAMDYYPKITFEKVENGFIIKRIK